MKTLVSLWILLIFAAYFMPGSGNLSSGGGGDDEVIVVDQGFARAVLKTANGCGIGNFLIPVKGDSASGGRLILGCLLHDWNPLFYELDSLPGDKILGVAFKRREWENNTSLIDADPQFPYVVITDSGFWSYTVPFNFNPETPEASRTGSLPFSGIRQVAKHTTIDISNPIAFWADDSLGNPYIFGYSYPALQPELQFAAPVSPELMALSEGNLFITGTDTNGQLRLFHYVEDSLYGQYALNGGAANAQELVQFGDSVYLLSSPGDSVTMLTYLNLQNSSLNQSVVYGQSGARATHNDFESMPFFTFQPRVDTTLAGLDQNIQVLDPKTASVTTFYVNREMDYFKHPQQFGQTFAYFEMEWIGGKWSDTSPDSLWLGQYFGGPKRISLPGVASDINATYGCWASSEAPSLNDVQLEYYPNPASSEVTLHLTGLKKGYSYILEITDVQGNVLHQTEFSAYEKKVLPLERFAKGVYFLYVQLGEERISKKLIIQ